MNHPFHSLKIPRSRIATFDVYAIANRKHHVSALLEFDVTESRQMLRKLRKNGTHISFNAWLIKMISLSLGKHPDAASFLKSRKKLIHFAEHNFSFVVEKQIGDHSVPLPMVLERVNSKSASEISREIEEAKNHSITKKDVVLSRESTPYERLYYRLPGFLRRAFWKYLLSHPRTAFSKMGNVSITSPGTAGKISGWFIHKSVHPLSIGIGSVIQKPLVVSGEIKVRDVLNMTVLIDHDLMDGAPMVRFLKELTRNIENGVIDTL